MKNRWMSLVGVVLIAVGLVLFLGAARIFATFLLEIVAGPVGPTAEVPPQEFSWGVKTFGNSNAELARAGIGALLMSVGYFLLVPALAPSARGAARVGLFVNSGLMGFSGLLWMWVAISFYGTLRTLAMSGAVNPLQFGEDLPVRAADLARYGLVAGMGLVAILGIAAVCSRAGGTAAVAPGRRLLARFSGAAALGFGACLMSVAFGPLTGVLAGTGTAGPVMLAEQIQTAIVLIGFAGASLVLAGGLGIVVASLRAGRSGEGE